MSKTIASLEESLESGTFSLESRKNWIIEVKEGNEHEEKHENERPGLSKCIKVFTQTNELIEQSCPFRLVQDTLILRLSAERE